MSWKTKTIILRDNFNLFLNSVHQTKGGSPVLQNLLFQNSLKLKKNTSYMAFGELEIQKKNASHFDTNIAEVSYK